MWGAPPANSGEKPLQGTTVTTVDQILSWLPLDTETVIVARGPFTVVANPFETEKKLSFAQELQALVLWPFDRIRKEVNTLVGQKVLLAVEVTRRFRNPTPIGIGIFDDCPPPYDGCHIIVFAPNLSGVGERFMNRLKSRAKTTQIMAGEQVVVFEYQAQKNVCRFLLAQAKTKHLVMRY